jgi:hypothetical protein
MTSATASIAPPRSGGLLSRFQATPARLKAIFVTISGAALILMGIAIGGVHSHRSGLNTVGVIAVPSIIAANHMVASMQDMDASAASFLTGRPGANMAAEDAYDAKRQEVGAALLEASRNVTLGVTVQKPIGSLQDGLVRYEAKIAEAKTLHEHGDEAFLAAYRSARSIMEGELKPSAADLDRANQAIIESVYADTTASAWHRQLGVLGVGVLLLAALLYGQFFLSTRMQRTVNPSLAIATLLAGGFVGYTLFAFHVQTSALSEAKENAFRSVHAMLSVRALAFDAKGDESRWLLDHPLRDRYESDFAAKSSELATQVKADAAAAAAYQAFLETDKKVRSLENGNQHAKAISLAAGNDPGESTWAFNQFDQVIGKTLDAGQTDFDASIARGFAAVAWYDLIAPVVAFLVFVLTFVGLRPRMKEYDV